MVRSRWEPIYSTAVGVGRALFGFWRLKRTVLGAENLPATGGAVFAITHFGYLDFALAEWVTWLQTHRRVRFLTKKAVFDKPLVGAFLRGMKHIPVDMKAGAGAYSAAVAAVQRGELIGIFPEAGVSASFTVRELKTGTIRLAAEAGVPIIPIAIWGGQRLLTKNHRVRFSERFGVPVHFAIGTPIVVSATDGVVTATETLRETLQRLISVLQASYPVDGTEAWWQPRSLGGTAPTPTEAATAEAERRKRREIQQQLRR